MATLVCENLRHLYSVGTPFETVALDDVSISVEKGEVLAIIGHTGSGKSTLIQHLNGLLKPNSGSVFLNNQDIWAKENKKNLRNVRFTVGLCFQYPEYQIFEDNIYKEIAFGPKQMGLSNEEIEKRVFRSMDFVGLDKRMKDKSPFDLSGGQKRRVAIASIIAMEPKILILDEPTAGLDPKGREQILQVIKDYQYAMDNTVILVSHSMEDVAKIAKRVIVMNKAKIEMSGSVKDVYEHSTKLREIGLNIPQITDIFAKLREKGIDCRTDIFTVEQGEKELKRLLLKKGVVK